MLISAVPGLVLLFVIGADYFIEMNGTDLLAEYRDTGSEGAFSELVRRYTNLVYSIAKRRLSNVPRFFPGEISPARGLDGSGGGGPIGVRRRGVGAVHVHVAHGGQGVAGAGQEKRGCEKYNPKSEIELPQKNAKSAKSGPSMPPWRQEAERNRMTA